MESTSWDRDRLAAALSEADEGATLARRIRPGLGFFALLGGAVAVTIAATAVGAARQVLWLPALGAVVFVGTALTLLAGLRRRSGARVSTFEDRVIFGTSTPAVLAFGAGLAGATWAAFEKQAWLVALCAVLGGVAYAAAGRLWVARLHDRPSGLWRGTPLPVQLLLVAAALAGAIGLIATSR